MFGYFRPDEDCPIAQRRVYKKYYCCLCHALKREYGALARYTLSYDTAFFMMLTAPNDCLGQVGRIRCVSTSAPLRQVLSEATAQKAAALNLLLTAAKLEDDIQDENRRSARLLRRLYAAPIRKAIKNQPHMWAILKEEYAALRKLEQKGGELSELEAVFSRMMVRVARECFQLGEPDRLACLDAAARWLYFIDAVDDLDRDVARGCFNPFAGIGSFKALLDGHYAELAAHFSGIFRELPLLGNHSPEGTVTDRFLRIAVPRTTLRVLTERRGGK